MNELATQRSHLSQSSFQASNCTKIFSCSENDVQEHHRVENCIGLAKIQIEEAHS